jgi:hypothetical protein
MFKPKDALDRAFQIGIIAKGLNGLAELSAACCCSRPREVFIVWLWC